MEAFAADQKGHLLPRPTPAFRDWEVLQRHVVLKPSDTAVWRCSAGEEKVARAVLSVNSAHAKANGGAGGIRTLDTGLPYTHFPGVRLRPLGHRSACLFGQRRASSHEIAPSQQWFVRDRLGGGQKCAIGVALDSAARKRHSLRTLPQEPLFVLQNARKGAFV